jgi:Protein of unknown function (DUF2798)
MLSKRLACNAFTSAKERSYPMKSSNPNQPAEQNLFPNIVFGFILSGLMSLIVSGISSARVYGLDRINENLYAYAIAWLNAYLSSWVVAFPVVLVIAPLVRKIVHKLFSKSSD